MTGPPQPYCPAISFSDRLPPRRGSKRSGARFAAGGAARYRPAADRRQARASARRTPAGRFGHPRNDLEERPRVQVFARGTEDDQARTRSRRVGCTTRSSQPQDRPLPIAGEISLQLGEAIHAMTAEGGASTGRPPFAEYRPSHESYFSPGSRTENVC